MSTQHRRVVVSYDCARVGVDKSRTTYLQDSGLVAGPQADPAEEREGGHQNAVDGSDIDERVGRGTAGSGRVFECFAGGQGKLAGYTRGFERGVVMKMGLLWTDRSCCFWVTRLTCLWVARDFIQGIHRRRWFKICFVS